MEIGTALIEDNGIVTPTDRTKVLDRSKIMRERRRIAVGVLRERDQELEGLTAIGF